MCICTQGSACLCVLTSVSVSVRASWRRVAGELGGFALKMGVGADSVEPGRCVFNGTAALWKLMYEAPHCETQTSSKLISDF